MTTCCAIIVAAGQGRRLGRTQTKPYVPLGHRPLLTWSLDTFARCEAITSIILVVAAEHRDRAQALVSRWGGGKVIHTCSGGPTRSDSVRLGLDLLPGNTRLVAIHDGARPLVTRALIEGVVAVAASSGAAIPALPIPDTVKRGADRLVAETLDRASLHLAQTPQVFEAELIRRAYAGCPGSPEPTDDAQLVERLGHPVHLVQGDPTNIKITTPEDMRLAEMLTGNRPGRVRTGIGYDAHRLVEGRRLMLGGIALEHPLGLEGHSDADVLCHAVGDALLGAAGLGDLGVHFPDTDPSLRGMGGLWLLEQVRLLLTDAGFVLHNLDATVVCEAPRLSPHLTRMRDNLARALDAAPEQINLKATTTEGLGFTGRQEGIAAQATVLLADRSNSSE